MALSKKTTKNISYAPWDKWDPAKYLETYFHEIRQDEDETLQFLVKNLQDLKGKGQLRVLEFGAGPTVVHALAAVPVASEIHLTDYLQENLFEIQKWAHSDPGIFNWDPFTRRILELEGGASDQAGRERSEQ